MLVKSLSIPDLSKANPQKSLSKEEVVDAPVLTSGEHANVTKSKSWPQFPKLLDGIAPPLSPSSSLSSFSMRDKGPYQKLFWNGERLKDYLSYFLEDYAFYEHCGAHKMVRLKNCQTQRKGEPWTSGAVSALRVMTIMNHKISDPDAFVRTCPKILGGTTNGLAEPRVIASHISREGFRSDPKPAPVHYIGRARFSEIMERVEANLMSGTPTMVLIARSDRTMQWVTIVGSNKNHPSPNLRDRRVAILDTNSFNDDHALYQKTYARLEEEMDFNGSVLRGLGLCDRFNAIKILAFQHVTYQKVMAHY